MDEQKIAENLKQNITAQPYTPPAPAVQTGDPAFQSNISLGDPVVMMHLEDYFDLSRADKYSESCQRQLKTILEWASSLAQSNDLKDILKILHVKERELGVRLDKDRLFKLYRSIKVEAQINFMEAKENNAT